jgi:hypothetical protein
MTTHEERQRLAGMGNALRPDWPTASLYTHLTREHSNRSYRDLAVALAWIATDPDTKTPARLAEPGPWWTATRPVGTTVARHHLCPRCREPHPPTEACTGQPRDAIDRDTPARAAAKAAARQAILDATGPAEAVKRAAEAVKRAAEEATT